MCEREIRQGKYPVGDGLYLIVARYLEELELPVLGRTTSSAGSVDRWFQFSALAPADVCLSGCRAPVSAFRL
jgi:hypothetical protein